MVIDFEKFPYYPALRTRPAEVRGYGHLSKTVKDNLVPIVTLATWPNSDANQAIDELRKAILKRPFIYDITKEGGHQDSLIKSLLSPDENFRKWAEFVKKTFPAAVPVVQITPEAKQRQITRQAQLLEKQSQNGIAFRISDFESDISRIIAALSALDEPGKALVILDAGYIRESMSVTISGCISAVNEIRSEIPDSIITLVSTSFPASITPFCKTGETGANISIKERELHEAVGVDAVIYGDHSSIHSKVSTATGGRFSARVDYPMFDVWEFERGGSDVSGITPAANALMNRIEEIAEDETWGAGEIKRAASGDVDRLKTRNAWNAVRVNIHITKQLELSQQGITDEEDLDDEV